MLLLRLVCNYLWLLWRQHLDPLLQWLMLLLPDPKGLIGQPGGHHDLHNFVPLHCPIRLDGFILFLRLLLLLLRWLLNRDHDRLWNRHQSHGCLLRLRLGLQLQLLVYWRDHI